MSWQAHIDALLASEKVTSCSIHGQDGTMWACSPTMTPSKQEVAHLSSALQDDDVAAFLPRIGVVVNQEKYKYLRHSKGEYIYGIKGPNEKSVVICRSSLALVIGISASPITFNDTINVVQSLAEYLMSMQL
eukprot:m.203899 g.203899  ORF g.203899 m.203899 type:complete len:132 (+) comp32869_c0_seq1:1435-1830(+)